MKLTLGCLVAFLALSNTEAFQPLPKELGGMVNKFMRGARGGAGGRGAGRAAAALNPYRPPTEVGEIPAAGGVFNKYLAPGAGGVFDLNKFQVPGAAAGQARGFHSGPVRRQEETGRVPIDVYVAGHPNMDKFMKKWVNLEAYDGAAVETEINDLLERVDAASPAVEDQDPDVFNGYRQGLHGMVRGPPISQVLEDFEFHRRVWKLRVPFDIPFVAGDVPGGYTRGLFVPMSPCTRPEGCLQSTLVTGTKNVFGADGSVLYEATEFSEPVELTAVNFPDPYLAVPISSELIGDGQFYHDRDVKNSEQKFVQLVTLVDHVNRHGLDIAPKVLAAWLKQPNIDFGDMNKRGGFVVSEPMAMNFGMFLAGRAPSEAESKSMVGILETLISLGLKYQETSVEHFSLDTHGRIRLNLQGFSTVEPFGLETPLHENQQAKLKDEALEAALESLVSGLGAAGRRSYLNQVLQALRNKKYEFGANMDEGNMFDVVA